MTKKIYITLGQSFSFKEIKERYKRLKKHFKGEKLSIVKEKRPDWYSSDDKWKQTWTI